MSWETLSIENDAVEQQQRKIRSFLTAVMPLVNAHVSTNPERPATWFVGLVSGRLMAVRQRLSGVDKHVIQHVIRLVLIAVCLFLALDAERSPRHGR